MRVGAGARVADTRAAGHLLRHDGLEAGTEPSPQGNDRQTQLLALFNPRDWDGLRVLLADDVKLHQSAYPVRAGSADMGTFFTHYARLDAVWLAPAWLNTGDGGREVIVVFRSRADTLPSYIMWLEWRDGRIITIRDYRYCVYVVAEAELVLGPDGAAVGDNCFILNGTPDTSRR